MRTTSAAVSPTRGRNPLGEGTHLLFLQGSASSDSHNLHFDERCSTPAAAAGSNKASVLETVLNMIKTCMGTGKKEKRETYYCI